MKKIITSWNIFSLLSLLVIIATAVGPAFPVQAQSGTPVAPTMVAPGGTAIVPDTGAPAAGGFLFSGWTLLIILAVVVVVLLVTLLAHDSSNPPAE